jgi:regulator of sigma E protease
MTRTRRTRSTALHPHAGAPRRPRRGRASLAYAFVGVLAVSLAGPDQSVGSWLLAIVGIGSLIAIHEAGHFFACRLTGTRVETFSIGFGPRLFGWETPKGGKRRFTVGARRFEALAHAMDVRIAAIPLGGYVKMAGEIGGDGTASSGAVTTDGTVVGATPRPPLPDEFPGKTIAQRAFIASAGVIMNAFAAIVCFTVAYGVGFPDSPPMIGDVTSGGPAWKAGLRAGDRLLSYDGQRIRTFYDLRNEVLLGPRGEEAVVEIERDGKKTSVRVTPEPEGEGGLQVVRAEPVGVLTVTATDGTKVDVGATDAVVVDGRPVVGGARAGRAILDALEVGHPSVRIERSGAAAVEVRLASREVKEATSGPWRLGITPAWSLAVEAIRPGGRVAADWKVGDEIVKADGDPVQRRAQLATRSSWKVATVRRGATEVELPVGASDPAAVTAWLDDVAFTSKSRDHDARIAPSGLDFLDGVGPAGAAGMRSGDQILAIDGKPVASWDHILAAGKSFSDAPVRVKVQTGTEPAREVTVKPARPRDSGVSDEQLRLRSPEFHVPISGPIDAIRMGFGRTVDEVHNVFRTIVRFFRGDISFTKNVAGPISIAQMSSGAASLGLAKFLAFLAFISVNLAVLNILPVPILDGGTIVVLLAEKIRGKALPDAVVVKAQMVGMGLLLLLMFFAFKNDISHLFGG